MRKRKKSKNIPKTFQLITLIAILIFSVAEVTFSSIDQNKYDYSLNKEEKSNNAKHTISSNLKGVDKSLVEPIYRVGTEDKKIAITFDVNWAEKEHLYEILDVLDKNNVKSTFFVMGKWLVYPDDSNVEKLKEIQKRGHEIGNHSYSHADFQKISEDKMIREIKQTEDTINKIIGIKTELFRFPSGSYNENGVKVAKSLGYKAIQWDVDSVDWKELGLEREYNKVIKNVKSGSIVLFHNDGKYTPENLKRLIPKLKEQGYEFVTLGQLLYKDNFYIDNEGVQRLKVN